MTATVEAPSLDTALEKVEELRKERAEAYRRLVLRCFRGESVTPDEIDSILAAAEKTTGNLRDDVENCKHREKLRERMQLESHFVERMAELEKEIAKLDRELQKAEEKHRNAVMPISFEIDQCRQGIVAAMNARQDLIHGCTNLELRRRQRELNGKQDALAEERKAAEREVARIEAGLQAVNNRIAKDSAVQKIDTPGLKKYRQDELAEKNRVEVMLENAKRALADIDRRREESVAEGEDLVQKLIDD